MLVYSLLLFGVIAALLVLSRVCARCCPPDEVRTVGDRMGDRRALRVSGDAIGLRGENMMRHCLDDRLDPREYVVLHDVMLPGYNGMPTQIDHIVVSRFGIFVIEMKNYSGEIRLKGNRWRKGGSGRDLGDPVWQNAQHVRTISRRMNIPEELIEGLVAVSHRARFAGGLPRGVHVFHQVPKAIRSRTRQVIKTEQVPEVVAAIRAWGAKVSPWERRHFIDIVKSRRRRRRI